MLSSGEETTLDDEDDSDSDNKEDDEEEDVVLKDSLRTNKVTGFLLFSFTTSHYEFFKPLHIC